MDLAGGTLDIYPLYLFEEYGLTVNAAINYGSEVIIEERDDKRVVLRALDINASAEAECISDVCLDGDLSLLARVARHYLKDFDRGVNISTRNRAPKGSGLGASSCLIITMSGALLHLLGKEPNHYEMVNLASHLEAQIIRIPTGKQDYYPAAFGGVNALWFEPGQDRVEPLGDAARQELNDRVVLSYTGVSHFSALSNWLMIKRYIDDSDHARSNMAAIKQIAQAMYDCIKNGDWRAFADQVDEEWRFRKGLATGVTTTHIDTMMESAKLAGAYSSKICGAGGGGCMITVVPPDKRNAVCEAIQAEGGQILDYEVQAQGLTVEDID